MFIRRAGLLVVLLIVTAGAFVALAATLRASTPFAQGRGGRGAAGAQAPAVVLRPARVFDGNALQRDWVVVVRGGRIESAGPGGSVAAPAAAETIDLTGLTL